MRIVNVSEVIDQHGLTTFQILVVSLCFLIVAIEGFDTASIGFLAPAIRQEWGLTAPEMAPLFGCGLFGLMAGAFVFGPISDRFGRKISLIICVLFFGVASLAAAHAQSLLPLVALRFLTGVGIGGAMPNAITLTSEYCSERHRLFLVTGMFCGFTIGSALGGIASAHMVGAYGWRSVLLLGGILPIVLVPFLVGFLPESVRYLVLREKALARVATILKHISSTDDYSNVRFVVTEGKSHGLPVGHLFKPELVVGTLLLWLAFFCSLLVIYLLSSWLPTLIKSTGTTLETASIITAMFQVGGTLGAVILGWLMDRFNPQYVLAVCYATAAIFIAAIGSLTTSTFALAAVVLLAGFCISGSQVGANALAASFYPTDCRATGVSWANGVGRIGSVVGSMSGGALIAMQLPLSAVFVVVGFPALIGGAVMLIFGKHRAPRGR
ncbi:MFS transporter [Acidocella aromatica]|uniref:AAHS family 4-hydroxybenzoate transporter-like MFS transporter n=1 Tax=Acidocella aromatica TaxID=1303579 RepID=A0A840VEZ9_9PROT|nr:aromatic acid/H+ symport family MFS transporter [Acidocella aromatica]MBB5374408.1 AAHS family 4-hydroxybenzoate transporter-like MFS transporter [Acidocella aromatica]